MTRKAQCQNIDRKQKPLKMNYKKVVMINGPIFIFLLLLKAI